MRKFFLFSLIFIGLFFYLGTEKTLAATEITADVNSAATWNKEGSPYIMRKSITVSAPLTIEPGVIVKFDYSNAPGVNARLVIQNEFTAVGTSDERIYFTSIRDDEHGGDDNGDGVTTKPGRYDWTGIYTACGAYNIRFEYISIFYSSGGLNHKNNTNSSCSNFTLKNSDISNNYKGLEVYNAEPIIKNNIISSNNTGIRAYTNTNDIIPTFRNNSIFGNGIGLDGRASYGTARIEIDAKYNWWGDESGPYYDYDNGLEEKNVSGNGNRILGYGAMFRPWLNEDSHLTMKGNPVILVPGIGASVNWDVMVGKTFSDKWTIYSHTYDGIIQALKEMGYEEGKDLFICHYDWRMGNADSANKYLKPLIEKAKTISGSPRVDIIAHSMGGIVARSYVQSNEYNNDIDNLILIAAPNKGSSDVYPVWEGGYIPKTWENRVLISGYLGYMNAKKHTFSNYETVHQYIPSVKELMPIYDYIYLKNDDSDVVDYSTMEEVNNFLIDLENNAEKLNNRVRLSVIAGNNQETVNTIPVVSVPEENPLWKDGKPDPINPEKDSNNGDGRIMHGSAIISSLFQNTLNYNHGDIVSQSEKIIASRILENLDMIYPAPDIFDEVGFWFASPLDVEIKDPTGKIISKDINNISLAQYSSESKPDGFKFISIPNPIKGEYKIKITGNGDDEYHIGSEYADYTGEKQDSSSIAGGEIKIGEIMEYEIGYNPQNLEEPVSEIKLNDTTPPAITGNATTQPNANSWYNNDVTVHFEAQDNESGIDFVTPDVILSTEGANQSVTGTATDKAGNSASFTVSGINIDKTAPQISISSPKEKEYLNSNFLEVNYAVSDSFSSPEKIESEVYYDSQLKADKKIDLSLEHLGNHQLKITAQDEAENQAEENVSFSITTNISAIIDNLNHYYDLKLITSEKDKEFLEHQLKILEKNLTLLEKIRENDKIKPRVKESLIKLFEKLANRHIDLLIKFVETNRRGAFTEQVQELLIESLNSIRPR